MIQLGVLESIVLSALIVLLLSSIIFMSISIHYYKHRAEKKAVYLRNEREINENLWKEVKKLQYKIDAINTIIQEDNKELEG